MLNGYCFIVYIKQKKFTLSLQKLLKQALILQIVNSNHEWERPLPKGNKQVWVDARWY